MEITEVEARVRKVVAKALGVSEDAVKPESRFVQDLHADSIKSIELVAGFEAEFKIDMDEDDALAVKTVGDAVTFIAQYVAAKEGGQA